MRERIAIKVKLLRIGTGVGIRLPNEIVRKMDLKIGKEVEIVPKGRSIDN